MNNANQVEICINGVHYHIATNEPAQYLQELAHDVDTQLQTLLERNPSMSFNDAAVLCLLNYADNYRRSEESADHMRNQISDYLEDAAKARIEVDEANRRIETFQRERERLRQDIERLTKEVERYKRPEKNTGSHDPARKRSGRKSLPRQAVRKHWKQPWQLGRTRFIWGPTGFMPAGGRRISAVRICRIWYGAAMSRGQSYI